VISEERWEVGLGGFGISRIPLEKVFSAEMDGWDAGLVPLAMNDDLMEERMRHLSATFVVVWYLVRHKRSGMESGQSIPGVLDIGCEWKIAFRMEMVLVVLGHSRMWWCVSGVSHANLQVGERPGTKWASFFR
jgi:hypothetical protein